MFQRAKDPFKIKKQMIDDRQMMTMMKDNSKNYTVTITDKTFKATRRKDRLFTWLQ